MTPIPPTNPNDLVIMYFILQSGGVLIFFGGAVWLARKHVVPWFRRHPKKRRPRQ